MITVLSMLQHLSFASHFTERQHAGSTKLRRHHDYTSGVLTAHWEIFERLFAISSLDHFTLHHLFHLNSSAVLFQSMIVVAMQHVAWADCSLQVGGVLTDNVVHYRRHQSWPVFGVSRSRVWFYSAHSLKTKTKGFKQTKYKVCFKGHAVHVLLYNAPKNVKCLLCSGEFWPIHT
eukprot:6492338-Amphidinium_carterae.1